MSDHNTTLMVEKPIIAALLAIFAFLCLSLAGVFSKMLTGTVPEITIFFFQFAVCFFFCLPWVFSRGVKRIYTKRLPMQITRGVLGLLSYMAFLESLSKIPLVNATVLLYASPLWVPLILLAWLKTKVAKRLWWGILIGFAGMLLILRPNGDEFVHYGTLLALLSGFLYGVVTVVVRQLLQTEPTDRILFYYFLICMIISMPIVLLHWQPLTEREWVILLVSGVAMFGCQFAFTQALRFADSSFVAVFSYAGVVFSGIFGFVLFHQEPSVLSILGILLVIVGGGLTILLTRRRARTVP